MIKLVCCGKMRMKWMKEGVQEYSSRIQPYDKIQIIEVQDEKAPENNSASDDEKVKQIEGQRMLGQIRPEEYVILCSYPKPFRICIHILIIRLLLLSEDPWGFLRN